LLVSYGANAGTLPGAIALHGWTSSYGLLFNLIAIPIAVGAVYAAVAALAVSTIYLPAGAIAAWLPDMLLNLLSKLTEWIAALPAGTIALKPWALWYIILFTGLVMLGSRYLRFSAKGSMIILALLPVMLLGYEMGVRLYTGQEVRVVFLDAGQADAAVIHAHGKMYMVDVGEEYSPSGEYAAHNGAQVEGIFLSHPHSDHAGGLPQVLECASVKRIYLPSGWDFCEQDEGVADDMLLARSMGIPITYLSAGDVIRLSDEVFVEVLSPQAQSGITDGNDLSLVMRMSYGDADVLFTGDLTVKGEYAAIPDVEVLKVAHHGAASSSSTLFLASAAPEVSVISVGENNSYGHPAQALLLRLERTHTSVFRTDVHGEIAVSLSKNGEMRVNVEKEDTP